MKNQSFHPKKARVPETPQLNFAELKDRTITALNKLGSQKFSGETGGYSLDNWARGVNILLDDFQEKIGEQSLPSGYFEKRRELNDTLAKPVYTPLIDGEIAEIRQRMTETKDKIAAETERLESKIAELTREKAGCSAQLAREQEKVSNSAAERSSGSFFRRLIGRDAKSSQIAKSAVEELKGRLAALDQETLEQQRLLKSIERRSPESQFTEDWRSLESLQDRLEALTREKSDNVQLVKIRAEFTTFIADTISKIST